MKKLMILTAALATGIMAYGELSNKFDAANPGDDWTVGWTGATAKATLDQEGGVLKIATGSEALERYVSADGKAFDMVGNELYFDVSLDLLGQALDEIPTIPSDARLALFLLDTTEIDGAPAGTNLYAVAQNPNGGKILAKMMTSADSLLTAKSRITVQAYKNVLKGGNNSGFVLYLNGGAVSGTVDPVKIDRTYSFASDGSTVDWNSRDLLAQGYLFNALNAELAAKRECMLLNLQAKVDGQSFNTLGFTGNASLSTVEVTGDRYGFIAEDKAPDVASVTLSGVTISVNPAEAYNEASGTLNANCTITVNLDAGLDILKFGASVEDTLTKNENGTFSYEYSAANDIFFTAVASSVSVGDKAYETVADAVSALGQKGTLRLNRNLTGADFTDGFLIFEGGGEYVLDLAGKNIVAAGDSTDGHGVVYLAEGKLTIINSDETNVGCVESTVSGRPAVCCEDAENATIRIEGGIFKGLIRDIVLESSEEAEPEEPVEGEEATEGDETVVTPNITIVGGKFTDDPEKFIDKTAYHVTREDGYYVVITGATPSVEPATPGEEKEYASEEAAQEAANAINADKENTIKVPEALAESDKTAYVNLFEATVNGTKVTLALTAVATEDLQAQVDAEVKKVDVAAIAAATETSSQTLTTTPGIFYSVVAGDTLTGMKVKSCTMATSNKTEITLPKFEGSGFYKIQATITEQTVE